MKVDGMFGGGPVMESTEAIVARAQQLEELGYDGLQIAEVAHDPFLPLVLAAHQTSNEAFAARLREASRRLVGWGA